MTLPLLSTSARVGHLSPSTSFHTYIGPVDDHMTRYWAIFVILSYLVSWKIAPCYPTLAWRTLKNKLSQTTSMIITPTIYLSNIKLHGKMAATKLELSPSTLSYFLSEHPLHVPIIPRSHYAEISSRAVLSLFPRLVDSQSTFNISFLYSNQLYSNFLLLFEQGAHKTHFYGDFPMHTYNARASVGVLVGGTPVSTYGDAWLPIIAGDRPWNCGHFPRYQGTPFVNWQGARWPHLRCLSEHGPDRPGYQALSVQGATPTTSPASLSSSYTVAQMWICLYIDCPIKAVSWRAVYTYTYVLTYSSCPQTHLLYLFRHVHTVTVSISI